MRFINIFAKLNQYDIRNYTMLIEKYTFFKFFVPINRTLTKDDVNYSILKIQGYWKLF